MSRLIIFYTSFSVFFLALNVNLFGTILPINESFGEPLAIMLDTTRLSVVDTLLLAPHLLIQNSRSAHPLAGAIVKISDPTKHGVIYTYTADENGFIDFDLAPNQMYFIRVLKDGYEPKEMKIDYEDLLNLERLTLIEEVPQKMCKFVSAFSQLTNLVFFKNFPTLETYQCWRSSSIKLNSNEIVGFSHNKDHSSNRIPFISF